jgi:hypothetical protein
MVDILYHICGCSSNKMSGRKEYLGVYEWQVSRGKNNIDNLLRRWRSTTRNAPHHQEYTYGSKYCSPIAKSKLSYQLLLKTTHTVM